MNNYNILNLDTDQISLIGKIVAGLWVIFAAMTIFMIICMWKIYKKAGKPGWAAIVPIYNVVVLLEVAELPMWYIVLLIIPFANIYAMFKVYIEIAHKFGKSTGFGVSTVFFSMICLPILAFGKGKYKEDSNDSEPPVTTENSPLPQTFSSETNNSDINNINTINNQSNTMAETGFVPVGDLNNKIQNYDVNNNPIETIHNTEVVNTPATPIPNVEPKVPPTQVDKPVQTIVNNNVQVPNNSITNTNQNSVTPTFNNNQGNNAAVFTNMNN